MACSGCSNKDSAEPAPRKVGTSSQASSASAPAGNPVVIIKTNLGTIKAELWADKAPQSVQNFLRYTNDGLYAGTIFHRVIPGFMIQGGGFTPEMQQKKTNAPIRNEARTDVKNKRGTLAMARTNVVDSATSQFFINVADNAFLDHQDDSVRGFGYAVFGKVLEGMDVVDRIVNVPTETVSGGMENVPVKAVVIESVTVQK